MIREGKMNELLSYELYSKYAFRSDVPLNTIQRYVLCHINILKFAPKIILNILVTIMIHVVSNF